MSKREQRSAALTARRSLSAEQRQTYSERICAHFMELPELQEAGLIFSYRATEDEANLALLHDWLRHRGQRLVFPTCSGGGRMEVYEPGGWKQGWMGIWEPDPALSRLISPEEIDLVLAPCVAFDAAGMRLGHGAGYYDRYFPRCPQARVIAAAFEAQRLERVDYGTHDRRMDAVVTEKKIYMV